VRKEGSGNSSKRARARRAARGAGEQRRERTRTSASPHTHHRPDPVTSLLLSPDGSYVVLTVTEPLAGKNTIVRTSSRSRLHGGHTGSHEGRRRARDARGRPRLGRDGRGQWVETGLRSEVAPRVQTRTEQNTTETAVRERGGQSQQTGQTGQGQSTQTQGHTGAQTQTGHKVAAVTGQRSQPPRTQAQVAADRRRGAGARPRGAALPVAVV